jgi:anti-sigma factor RsiW
MNPHNDPPDERLDAWLDGRLAAKERGDLERDLAASPGLRQELESLKEARRLLRQALPAELPPSGFENRLRLALDDEDRRAASVVTPLRPSSPSPDPSPSSVVGSRTRVLWAVAASFCLAALALFAWRASTPRVSADAVVAAFEEFERVREGGLPVAFEAGDAAEIEARWRAGGIAFPARVLDLAGMGLELIGGDATSLAAQPAARTIYGVSGRYVVCWMFLGSLADLPTAAERRSHGGFDFHIFHRGSISLVVWQEGDVLCALVGDGDPETVIGLAMGKAMRA